MTPPTDVQARHRVVIVGGGFGGLETVRALARAPVDVVLIDRQNHHCFQPLLYQVATAALSPADIAWPIRSILSGQPNLRVAMAIADVEEQQRAQVADLVDPAEEDDRRVDVRRAECAAGVRAGQRTELFSHSSVAN